MSRRVLFHVQHLLGVGHLKRAEILAAAMAEAGLDVTVALGGAVLPEVPFAGVRTAQLPPARIAGDNFSTLIQEDGQPADEAWQERRRAALLDLLDRIQPHVILIELFPFGRRQFAFELTPLLEAAHARQPRPHVVCSVRDILVASSKPGRAEEIAATALRYFDAVLVHGDPEVIPFGATFPAEAVIASLIRYTGYVAPPPIGVPGAAGTGEVLVSAGGGAVGAPLLLATLEARPRTSLRRAVWRLLTGPNLPAEAVEQLRRGASEQVIIERFRPDFPARLANCRLSISQGGYNTTMDLLRAGAQAVVVPYETAGETEQRRRSELLAAKGLLTVLPASELAPETLAAAIELALQRPAPDSSTIRLDGAAETARIVAEMAL